MTVIVLCVAVVLQSVVIVFQAVAHQYERGKLLDRIMSRDLDDYRRKDGTAPVTPRKTPYSKLKEAWRSPGGKDEA